MDSDVVSGCLQRVSRNITGHRHCCSQMGPFISGWHADGRALVVVLPVFRSADCGSSVCPQENAMRIPTGTRRFMIDSSPCSIFFVEIRLKAGFTAGTRLRVSRRSFRLRSHSIITGKELCCSETRTCLGDTYPAWQAGWRMSCAGTPQSPVNRVQGIVCVEYGFV